MTILHAGNLPFFLLLHIYTYGQTTNLIKMTKQYKTKKLKQSIFLKKTTITPFNLSPKKKCQAIYSRMIFHRHL